MLQRLHDEPPEHGFYFMPAFGEPERWAEWTAVLLGEADLLSGRTTQDGISTLRVTAEGLRRDGAYPESDRAQVEAWLKLRNALAHPDGREVSDARVESVIQGIRVFLAEHPT